ncbi:MAG: L,D-transpeptidase [Leptolyngbyaceae cyanobacterium MO_188.B28]|nr:L,D-transpeptidase [Leptolyngbyaceae cyanobacterium MO_188.B28]
MDHQRSLKIGLSSAIFLLAVQPRVAAQTAVGNDLKVDPSAPIRQDSTKALMPVSASSLPAQSRFVSPEPIEVDDIRFSLQAQSLARITVREDVETTSVKWNRPAPIPDLLSPATAPHFPQAQPVFPEPLEPGIRFSNQSQDGAEPPVSVTEETPLLAWVRPPAAVQTQMPLISPPELPQVQPIFPQLLGNIRLEIDLSERTVYVYQEGELTDSYPVAVGRPGWETPVGEYHVMSMLQNPGWTHPLTGEVVPPGPDNPLGERWIAFWTDGNNLIGFHGTPNRESIGRAASHGCVRMFNEDVRELYEMVRPGTTVVVKP